MRIHCLILHPPLNLQLLTQQLGPSGLYNSVWPMTLCIQPITISQLSTAYSIVCVPLNLTVLA